MNLDDAMRFHVYLRMAICCKVGTVRSIDIGILLCSSLICD